MMRRSGNKRGREEDNHEYDDYVPGNGRGGYLPADDFRAICCGVENFDLQFVLQRLRKEPQLAKKYILFDHDYGIKAKPLSIVLRRSTVPVPLDVVKEIYNLYPNAVNLGGYSSGSSSHFLYMYPLFLACHKNCKDDVVEFLATKSEADVLPADVWEGYPHYEQPQTPSESVLPFMRDLFVNGSGRSKYTSSAPPTTQLLSFPKVKILLEKYPKLLEPNVIQHYEDDTLLEDAVKSGYSREILNYIVEKLPSPKTLSLRSPTSYTPHQLVCFGQLLQSLPPLITKLTWTTANQNGLTMLLSFLGIEESGNDGGTNTTTTNNDSGNHLQTNTTVTSMTLTYGAPEGDAFVLQIVKKLIKWGQLQELTIKSNLPEFDEDDDEEADAKAKTLEEDLIDLCHLLRNDQKLQALKMEPPWITTKKPLVVMAKTMEKNTTLQNVLVADQRKLGKFPSFKRIQFYCKLNQCNRALTQNPSTNIAAFVQLLVDIPLDRIILLDETTTPTSSSKKNKKKRREKELHNMMYGLLREAPGLWSSVVTTK